MNIHNCTININKAWDLESIYMKNKFEFNQYVLIYK